tara:strand:+ start:14913 stop:17150 length:2238 start_codon:yes stop_codon:yes gene_type:complete
MANREYVSLGKSVARADGPEKVTGQAEYTLDKQLKDVLWGKILRSPYPHAEILSIDTHKAKALPGVYSVLTGTDVRNIRIGRRLFDVPILANNKVRFIGDKVAAVAAETKEIAEEALSLIEVQYKELEAVTDIHAASSQDAPILHPDLNEYIGLPKKVTDRHLNIYSHDNWTKGDINSGFEQSDIVVEKTYSTPKGHQGYLEPHTCMVWVDAEDQIQIWASNKAPFMMRSQLSTAFNIDPEKFTVNPTYIGGDFGGKGSSMDIPLCYALAKDSKKPVRMSMDYSEELIAGNPRHGGEMKIRAGITTEGTLVAWDAQATWDSGAYGGYKPVPSANLVGAAHLAGSPYRIPNVNIDSYQVYTNTVPSGHYRAPGAPQAIFAAESHIDALARQIDMDPYEFRMKNIIGNGEPTSTGHYFENINAGETLELAAKSANYFSTKAPNTGRGIAMGDHGAPGGETSVSLIIELDGTITASTPLFEQGAGQYTVIQQVISEELSLPTELITVKPQDTTFTKFDSGIGGSHTTRIAVEAAHIAGKSAKDELFKRAAELMGWSEENLSIQDQDIVAANGQRISIEDLLEKTGVPVSTIGHVNETKGSKTTSYGAQIAEVEVDPETGQIYLRNFTTSHDVGTIINPTTHQGQIEGGVIQAMGFALMEELIIDESGRVSNPSLADFKIPTGKDLPEMKTSLLQNDIGSGSYNVKSAGESSNTPTAAAIANAIEDAIGIRVQDLPITSEKIYNLLHRK